MRERLLPYLAMLLCLLCACGGKENNPLQAPMDFRAGLLAAGGCTYTGHVTLDTGERVYDYTLQTDWSADGRMEARITAPDLLAGITARLEPGSTRLEYDGVAMDLGDTGGGPICPMNAPALVCAGWSEGYIACADTSPAPTVTYESGWGADTVTVNTRFEDGLPVWAELVYRNRTVLTMEITDFSLSG